MRELGKIKAALEKRIRNFVGRTIRMVSPFRSLPLSLSFTLSNQCNLRCGFCPMTVFGIEAVKGIKPDVLDSILDLAENVGTVQILGLGEPLLNRIFPSVVEKLRHNYVSVSVTTNGLLLNERLAEDLCRLELNELIFSIEGAKNETHQIVKDSELGKLIANIKGMSAFKRKLKASRPVLSFNFVGMTNNISELPEVIELASTLGIQRVYVANVMPLDEKTSEYHLHRNPQMASRCIENAREIASKSGVALQVYASLSPHPTYCHWWDKPHVGLDGDVYPCNYLGSMDGLQSTVTIWYEGVSVKTNISNYQLGNIMYERLDRIWNAKKMKSLRRVFSESMEKDGVLHWNSEAYRNLLLRYQGRELPPEEFCRVCPHRFRITQ